MGARLFVDNLPVDMTEEELIALLSRDGPRVVSVSMMADRRSGESHGYAFVEMGTAADAAQAILELHGKQLRGRELHVSQARPRIGGPKAGP
jgi:RNA recognition motif-containing protein